MRQLHEEHSETIQDTTQQFTSSTWPNVNLRHVKPKLLSTRELGETPDMPATEDTTSAGAKYTYIQIPPVYKDTDS